MEAPFLRLNRTPPNFHAQVRPGPTLNVLLASARPGGRRDVGYRTISRPLVEALGESNIRAQIDIVRPGTYRALVEHLEETRGRRGDGYYHVVHFDVHGGLLTHEQYTAAEPPPAPNQHIYRGYGQQELAPYEGVKAFLLFDGPEPDQADLVADEHLAALLQSHQIPIAVLNACQSGKQVGAAGEPATSLCFRANVVLSCRYTPVRRLSMCDIESKKKEGTIKILIMLIIFPRLVRQQRPFSQRAGTAVLRFLAKTQPPDRAPGGGPPIDHYLAHALLRLAGAGAVEVLPAEVWSER